jgi:hypothetical protein
MFTTPSYTEFTKQIISAIDMQQEMINKSYAAVSKELDTYGQKGLEFVNQMTENAREFIAENPYKKVFENSSKK